MKKQYLITREQFDNVVANYLDGKMRGGRVKSIPSKYSKGSTLNAFIAPNNEVLFILYEWAESWEDDDGPRNVLAIDEELVDFFVRHIGVRKHKAMDIISDWFEETYDFDFRKVETSPSLKKVLDGWTK